jgi:hypothetical protein
LFQLLSGGNRFGALRHPWQPPVPIHPAIFDAGTSFLLPTPEHWKQGTNRNNSVLQTHLRHPQNFNPFSLQSNHIFRYTWNDFISFRIK